MKRALYLMLCGALAALLLTAGGCTVETPEQYRDRTQSSSTSPAASTATGGTEGSVETASSNTAAGSSGGEAATGSSSPAASPDTTAAASQTSAPPQTTAPAADTCTLSVSCLTILDNLDKLRDGLRDVVGDGILLPPTDVRIEDGDTVFDVLLRAMGDAVDYSGTKRNRFVEGIGQIYQKDCDAGGSSGWIFFVNEKYIYISCSAVKVAAGDVIEWKYTCNGGSDLQ